LKTISFFFPASSWWLLYRYLGNGKSFWACETLQAALAHLESIIIYPPGLNPPDADDKEAQDDGRYEDPEGDTDTQALSNGIDKVDISQSAQRTSSL